MTKKQMGYAGEMLVAAELTLAGVPALKVPDNWPGYDVVAQPAGGGPAQRVPVKTRTYKAGANFVEYNDRDDFDWLAIVFLPGPSAGSRSGRRFFVVPRSVANATASRAGPDAQNSGGRWWAQQKVADLFAAYEDNFTLSPTGRESGATAAN